MDRPATAGDRGPWRQRAGHGVGGHGQDGGAVGPVRADRIRCDAVSARAERARSDVHRGGGRADALADRPAAPGGIRADAGWPARPPARAAPGRRHQHDPRVLQAGPQRELSRGRPRSGVSRDRRRRGHAAQGRSARRDGGVGVDAAAPGRRSRIAAATSRRARRRRLSVERGLAARLPRRRRLAGRLVRAGTAPGRGDRPARRRPGYGAEADRRRDARIDPGPPSRGAAAL